MEKKESRVVGVIPSRWGSTRFPGKSLALIGGKPLIQWVLERAASARRLDEVLVATDDDRIREKVESLGHRAVMTRGDHPSGTDRIAEAIADVSASVVVNVQGDEPLVDPLLIDRLVAVVSEQPDWDMATAVVPITERRELTDPSVVKAVWAENGQALYFSRAAIPFIRENGGGSDPAPLLYWRHIGIYVYQRAFLEKMVRTEPCAIESAEKLEQLRALHIGARIKVVQAENMGPGVDVPEDVARAEAALKEAGLLK